MSTGRFVVFEGGEGSGKSTQSRLLAERWGALWTRQPGGTELGAALRAILLDGAAGELTDRAEALLMAADRAQHVEELIRPALVQGRDVVCDRYLASSVAYQGHGRGLDPDRVKEISEWAVQGLLPDLVVLLDVDPEVGLTRAGGASDRIEAAGAEFHAAVRRGFLIQAEADPDRWVVLDGSGGVEAVAALVHAAVEERLGAAVAGSDAGSAPGAGA